MSGRREGFTIIEVVVAMVMLAVILTALGSLTYATARTAIITSDATAREAVALEIVNRMVTMPSASLNTAAGCDTVGTPNHRYRRCVAVVYRGRYDSVGISITPLQRQAVVTNIPVIRARPPGANPLCTTC